MCGAQIYPFYVNVLPDDVHSPFWPPVARWGDGGKHALYAAVLEEMDRAFGRFFAAARARGASR